MTTPLSFSFSPSPLPLSLRWFVETAVVIISSPQIPWLPCYISNICAINRRKQSQPSSRAALAASTNQSTQPASLPPRWLKVCAVSQIAYWHGVRKKESKLGSLISVPFGAKKESHNLGNLDFSKECKVKWTSLQYKINWGREEKGRRSGVGRHFFAWPAFLL